MVMKEILSRLTKKKGELDKLRPLPPAVLANLDDWFRVELTYTSNALEGNTLSRAETALVVEKGITIEGKTLKEHLEAINHAQALDFVKELTRKNRSQITQKTILEIHKLILTRIDDLNAGRYRNVPVRIAGSRVVLPNAMKVPKLMDEFEAWLHEKSSLHPATLAAEAHYRLVTIHPFTDGNGRAGRLLMNLLLIQEGYPPAIIRRRDRQRYIDAIEQAQLDGTMDDFLAIIFEAAQRSLDIYLEASGKPAGKENQMPPAKFLKISELAKRSNEPVHTIRFWTKEGLLDVADFSPGGYQLYNPAMIDRAKEIRRLQTEERLTLAEIRARFKQR